MDDLVEGLVLLMNSNYSQPVNLGNPDEFTVKELAMIVRDKIGKLLKILSVDQLTVSYSAIYVFREQERAGLFEQGGRRSAKTPTGHHRGQNALELVTQGQAERGLGQDDRVLPQRAQQVQPTRRAGIVQQLQENRAVNPEAAKDENFHLALFELTSRICNKNGFE